MPEQCIHATEIRRMADDISTLTKSNAEVREKLFNGVSTLTARIPEIETTVTRIETKMDARKPVDGKTIAKRRSGEVAIMALIISAVSQWDEIIAFAQRFF